jgi:hypothetical protein
MSTQIHRTIDLGNGNRMNLDSNSTDSGVMVSLDGDSGNTSAWATVTPAKALEIAEKLAVVTAGAIAP